MSSQNTYNIRISPGVIKNDIFPVVTSGGTTAYTYSSMTQILSGGTNGDSLLTDLSIQIFLNETIDDIGYYSEWDGYIVQKDIFTNFIYSAESGNSLTYHVLNTSDINRIRFLNDTQYFLDWGDGTPIQSFYDFITPISHTYPNSTGTYYTISMTGQSPWGTTIIQNQVLTPFTGITISNPFGTVNFIGGTGNWASLPTSYDFIFSGDAINQISAQTSNNYTTVPFLITGYTKSRLNDLKTYGNPKFNPLVVITGATGFIGQYIGPLVSNPKIISYIIDGIVYYDNPDGTTYYEVYSSGITSDMIWELPITKEEALMGAVFPPEVQSTVYVDRGKYSVLESIQRLGEVDNIGDIRKYGYGFFNVKSQI